MMAYRKNEDVYLEQFINACFLPYERKSVNRSVTVLEELEELLDYEWDVSALSALSERSVKIEVYLGEKDQIVDAKVAKEFFFGYGNSNIYQRSKSLFAAFIKFDRI